ncbi:MAG: CBASS cGAMP-activated phospholipase [Sulfuricurvum sp.]|uniref:CBASS cGAMP-activated phospholipase n=1 Tax=Sulfuricurvum sp. TaxID=2025608 RepID=UPI00260EC998|nr:CBASS cGAMP-activated phospholipase [Sulfuricurvum sp.]MDD2370323.1 CBASS cGAMP-activated phospholipase [Sulfuricurvum sp.]MDD2949152.1 CBASS cGAMP-activated phospholipase [Sulfuricurvum sp.]MDD5118760.1 CBASS cGAMP-activated phospholipase [Sulfuricurvum sp.]
MKDMSKKFRILCLDGGGIRGLYSAQILKRIQDDCGIDFYNDFDLIVGTSTGSILAGSIVKKVAIDKVISLYENEGKSIFRKSLFPKMGLFGSKYSSEPLKEQLKSIFENTVLGDIEKPLLICATDIGNSTQFVFKTTFNGQNDSCGNAKALVRDKKIALYDAILASSSAPIFFPPHKIGNHLLADGGLWANSPVLVALAEAKKIFKIEPKDVAVVSIGTGVEENDYHINTSRWGFLNGWKREKFISMILNLQTKTNNSLLQFLMPKENILRLTYTSDKTLPLDDISQNKNLLSKADNDFVSRHAEIQSFINNHIKDKDVNQ